ncbi:DUF3592 domain-containing protein [Vineibacter terrae]|uniref:DUF3592 domain-containing protein n=1 Tax=Vineibacter terrae TaxID=2586908 RepID=UPI002E33D52C|nr:DUF3592 domain-containing protein [Vineibacter terrae]HEX2890704.1 DUF3592 domain-containing protein [Vineibacter terrae]
MALTFTRRTIRLFTRVGLVVALAAWPVVWGTSHYLFVTRTAFLERMRSEGVVVDARPVAIDGTLGWQRRDLHYDVTYRFEDKQGRAFTGKDFVTVSPNSAARNAFEALRDPQNPAAFRPDARVPVMYLPDDPRVNGLKLRFDIARVPEGSWGFMAGFASAVILGALVIGIGTLMEKRFRPE